MTKAEAYDILVAEIKGECISDIVYNEKPNAQAMSVILAYIDGTVDALNEVLRKEQRYE